MTMRQKANAMIQDDCIDYFEPQATILKFM